MAEVKSKQESHLDQKKIGVISRLGINMRKPVHGCGFTVHGCDRRLQGAGFGVQGLAENEIQQKSEETLQDRTIRPVYSNSARVSNSGHNDTNPSPSRSIIAVSFIYPPIRSQTDYRQATRHRQEISKSDRSQNNVFQEPESMWRIRTVGSCCVILNFGLG